MKLKDIKEHIQKLNSDKDQLVTTYKANGKEYKKLRQMDESLTRYLNETSTNMLEKIVNPIQNK